MQKGDSQKQYIISDTKNYDKQELGTIIKQILNKKTIKLIIPITLVLWLAAFVEFIFKIVAPNQKPLLTKEKINEKSAANWGGVANEVWKVLGCQPNYDLKSGMQQTIEWYSENKML